MQSIITVLERAIATNSAQASISAVWLWPLKTLAQWASDIALLQQQQVAEDMARTQLRGAAGNWDAALQEIKAITQDVVRTGRLHFAANADHARVFEALNTDGRSRADLYAQGLAAKNAWESADPTWLPLPGRELATLSSLLASSLAQQNTHGTKLAAWRRAAAALMATAQRLHGDNVTWYATATARFAEGTVEGDMIRSSVPTSTSTPQAVGQAVISNVMVAGDTIHFDAAADHATHYTYLQRSPGSAAYVVVAADTAETSLTLHGQPPGEHRFKVFGGNSQGNGPESAELVVTVSQSNVA